MAQHKQCELEHPAGGGCRKAHFIRISRAERERIECENGTREFIYAAPSSYRTLASYLLVTCDRALCTRCAGLLRFMGRHSTWLPVFVSNWRINAKPGPSAE
jgi:hypothetical protein